ncbi:TerB N-terminal domain-containing protein [Neobacillus mesonae]|nr:TerB N-terminal domain-containing protein [Neobacillus mesonae]
MKKNDQLRFAEFNLSGNERDVPIPHNEDKLDNNINNAASQYTIANDPVDLDIPDHVEWGDSGSSPVVHKDSAQSQSDYQALLAGMHEESLSAMDDSSRSIPNRQIYAPKDAVNEVNWEQDFRYISREQQFAYRARQLCHHTEEKAPFAPFHSYWPTYDQMSSEQYKWYFYWRSEVRSGNYPDTDLSYLFVYVYELINGIGWGNPSEGYDLMNRTWQAYRKKHPKLDTYMREWLYDFSMIHELEYTNEETFKKLPRNMSNELKELEWQRRFHADPVDLKWESLFQLLDYDPERSRFYIESGRYEMTNFTPKVIALVDQFLYKTKGVRLISRFEPRPRRLSRTLFRSALYDHQLYGRTKVVTSIPISEHKPLRAYLTQLVRFTENKLRELKGYKGRLRGIEIEDEVGELVTRYLKKEMQTLKDQTAKAVRPQVQINRSRLLQLQRESDEVRDMLLTDEVSKSIPPSVKKKQPASDITQTVMNFDFTAPAPMPTPTSLTKNMDYSRDEDLDYSRDEDLDSDAVSSEQLEAVSQEKPEITQSMDDASLFIWNVEELDEEWKDFASSLTAIHLQILYAVKHNQGELALQNAADKAGSMPALLIEEINEASMEHIGDLIIDNGAIPEEYISMLDKLCMNETR